MLENVNLQSTAQQNLYRLSLIRGVALLGQFIGLAYFSVLDPIGLPVAAIGLILAVYGPITAATFQRSRMDIPITDREFSIHLLVDIGFFSMLLFLSGGASNPFISYFLIPISIAAITLSRSHTAVIALVALAAYSLLVFHSLPLEAIAPSHHHSDMPESNLHVLGMWANFAVSAAIITYFISQMASTLKLHQQRIAEQREAQLRDDQLLAVGTLAAGTAHELGTPLNTMQLTIDEMLTLPDCQSQDDLVLLRQQIDQCRTTLKQLRTTAEQSASRDFPAQSMHSYFNSLFERWQLMRPALKAEIHYKETELSAPQVKFHPSIAQSILNLLNNAADASPEAVTVELSWSQHWIEIAIGDRGPGISPEAIDGETAFSSNKADGLGLGLFLSQTVMARYGGSVNYQDQVDGGTLTILTLPTAISHSTGTDR